jgi:curved DNA-binding protein CbpA
MKKSLYEKLGVPKDAKKPEIKRAYRNKAKELHPDKGGDTKEMAEINRAYRILMNDKLRIIYNETGQEDEPVNNIISEAGKLINEIFISLINEYREKLIKKDYLNLIKNEIKKEDEKLNSQINGMEKAVSSLRKLFEDIEHKNNKKHPDFLHITLAQQIQMIERDKFKANEQKKVTEISLEIIKQYKKKSPIEEEQMNESKSFFAINFGGKY